MGWSGALGGSGAQGTESRNSQGGLRGGTLSDTRESRAGSQVERLRTSGHGTRWVATGAKLLDGFSCCTPTMFSHLFWFNCPLVLFRATHNLYQLVIRHQKSQDDLRMDDTTEQLLQVSRAETAIKGYLV